MRTLRLGSDAADLERAAALLRDGKLVAVPTETVYGLAARADDADAVARLFAAKDRPPDNPLIVHVADIDAVTLVARELTPLARRLLERFAPGPLTVVLPARDELPRAVTGGLNTVAVRIPDHPVTLDLLRRTRLPLAAPSANRSGRPSPTRAEHVLADLDGRIDAVVDGGATRVGVESTVVDARGTSWQLLREGGVSAEELGAELAGLPRTDAAEHARSPGTRHRHYAPTLPVHLAAEGAGPALAAHLIAGRPEPDGRTARIGLIAVRSSGVIDVVEGVTVLAAPRDVAGLAAHLFTGLREAEQQGLAALVVEGVAEVGIGRAVMDRLRRAVDASGGTRPA